MVVDLQTAAIESEPYPEQSIATSMQPTINRTKLRNLLGLKLEINALPADESDEPNEVVWTIGLQTPEDSSPPLSLSPSKCVRSDDSGFSSDDNTQLIKKSSKLSRSKSLRSALRTPTLTPSESHKTVRFADSLGLNLVHKNYYEADDCSIELEDIESSFSSRSKRHPKIVGLNLTTLPERTEAEICHLTRTQCVCLQSVNVVDTNITGIIDVLNIACEKQVYVRYTTDNWETTTETAARYATAIGNDGAVDAFTFFVALPADLPIGATCQFCIRYVVNGTVYWDNSQGSNYMIQAVGTDPVEKKADKKVATKPPLPTHNARKHGSTQDVDDSTQSSFLPFSLRSSRNSQWRRQHAADREYFFRCKFVLNLNIRI